MAEKVYLAIDLKSFYASVECAERGLDPLDANLLVADESRTDKTICLAVSPALKSLGISGRARLFEAKERIRAVNRARARRAPGGQTSSVSIFSSELARNPALALDFVVAPPRMAYYMAYSRRIVEIYLRHVSIEDLLIYSIDEVFIDVTRYLKSARQSAHDFARMLIGEVLRETRITATAGIGTNLYLAKIAMDIVAKRIPPDRDGVRIAQLDERSYREQLWCHTPLTDFWRVGEGTARRLAQHGIYTMGDIARCSVGDGGQTQNEELLYRLFGVGAELLIDHAWGWEPVEIADCRAYRPASKSLSRGQVLTRPYRFEETKVVLLEMADLLSMDLLRTGLVCDQLVLEVGYDRENLPDGSRPAGFSGEIVRDRYGRAVPKPAHGSENLGTQTSLTSLLTAAAARLFTRITDPALTVRRLSLTVAHLVPEHEASPATAAPQQLDLFTDYAAQAREQAAQEARQQRERSKQEALLAIRARYGKNAIIRGLNLQKGATAIERNRQIGGHKA